MGKGALPGKSHEVVFLETQLELAAPMTKMQWIGHRQPLENS